MKIKVFALLAVLVMFAGVFTSCDNSDYEPMAQASEDASAMNVSASDNHSLRVFDNEYYHMSEDYKDDYTHVYHRNHGIAAGFVTLWNCIGSEEGTGNALTVSSFLSSVGATSSNNYKVDLTQESIKSMYNFTYDGYQKVGATDLDRILVDLLKEYWETQGNGRPVGVLVNFTGNQSDNILVPVFSVKYGRVYFSNPRIYNSNTSFESNWTAISIGAFIRHAKMASQGGETLNLLIFR